MRNAGITLAVGILIGSIGLSVVHARQDPGGQTRINLRDIDMAGAMQRWTDASTPGPQHEKLAVLIGDWTTTTKMWMDPAAPPVEVNGSATARAILGGRFIESVSRSTMMGRPMESVQLFGYSNVRNQFIGLGMSSMSTDMTVAGGGALSRDNSVLTLIATMNEPMTEEISKPVKMQIEFLTDDHYRVRLSEIAYGDPFRVVEIDYHRVKSES